MQRQDISQSSVLTHSFKLNFVQYNGLVAGIKATPGEADSVINTIDNMLHIVLGISNFEDMSFGETLAFNTLLSLDVIEAQPASFE